MIKSLKDLYNTYRKKIKNFENGSYYLCTSLEKEGKEKWINVKELNKYIDIMIKKNCIIVSEPFKQGLFRGFVSIKHYINQCTENKCNCKK